MILKAIIIYLIIGAFITLFEMIMVETGRRQGLCESPVGKEKFYDLAAYFVEVFIWPRQLFIMVITAIQLIKVMRSKEKQD